MHCAGIHVVLHVRNTTTCMHVVILVPFRNEPSQNRAAHLERFIAHMPAILQTAADAAGATFAILIGHAVHDGRLFARGRTLNALFLLSKHSAHVPTRVILHDVDLLPDAARAAAYFDASYNCCALARAGGEYASLKNYIGGAFAMPAELYLRINGFPNEMEGWGGEDDAMFDRLDATGVAIAVADSGTMTNLELCEGSARARETHACPKAVRRTLRAQWRAREPVLTGVCDLIFAASRLASPHASISQFKICSPVYLPAQWHMEFSSTTRLPYFVNDTTHERTYVPPGLARLA